MALNAQLLSAAVGFLALEPREPELQLLHRCFDNWRGVGEIVAGMARQDYDLELRRYDGQGWRAMFFRSLRMPEAGGRRARGRLCKSQLVTRSVGSAAKTFRRGIGPRLTSRPGDEKAGGHMEEARASITALGAALMRAVHTRVSASPLIDDAWGDRLVREAERETILNVVLNGLDSQTRERCEKLRTPSLVLDAALQRHPGYAWAVLRTRYAEDALKIAVGRGVGQYVIVGAGFDSFSLRQPAFARDVDVFEIDHPATQELKRERLHERGIPVPRKLHFVPADLSKERIGDALARSTFRSRDPAFFSWLGVTQYLSREANLSTLRGIATCSASESELVFTYVEQDALGTHGAPSSFARLQGAFAAAREPWLSGFNPSLLTEDLAAVGLALIEDLNGVDAKSRYCADRRDDLSPAITFHIARARVVSHERWS